MPYDLDTTTVILGAVAVLLLIIFLRITRHGGEADGQGVYNRLQRGWRRIAFWAGDVCVISHFPWITWDKHGHRVSEEQWMDAVALMKAGDVILATHKGYPFSNTAIPGCFKHAGFISEGPARSADGHVVDIRVARLIEAISAGVKEWSPMHARADLMIVLRPRASVMGSKESTITHADIERSVKTARKIVGCDYDTSFKFNIEDELAELHSISKIDAERAAKDERSIKMAAINVCAQFDMAFSCTETVATAWWHRRHDLRISRRKARGRNIIVADQFVNRGFAVVWTNVKADEAEALGMEQEGLEMLKEYWKEYTPEASA
jgi:hypothetical protein